MFFDTALAITQTALTAITLLMIFVKPFRVWFFNAKAKKKDEEKKDNERDEALRCTLRNMITEFYYSHKGMCEMYQYEYENMFKIYQAYKAMGGNSFIDKVWEELQTWTIV